MNQPPKIIISNNYSPLEAIRKQMHSRKRIMPNSNILHRLHLDPLLMLLLLSLTGVGLLILYSAANQDASYLTRQLSHLGLAFGVMFVFAQIPPSSYRRWSPWIYTIGVILLIAVLFIGHVDKGARRWLSLGFFRFQPSELMKLSLPMMLAWCLDEHRLPPKPKTLALAAALIALPMLLTAKQPDLGTAILIASAGACVLLLAGVSWRLVAICFVVLLISGPFVWHFMHDYQRQRLLTFLNPERDPLGAGYHIIQSKIAIGSGGLLGKGWLQGSQSHLHYLPEHATDFIFAVAGEEWGLFGGLGLLLLFLAIVIRSLAIALSAQDTFSRLLAGSLSLSFFIACFVNMGMVTGVLPVVGLPLPLVSYGGTYLVTLLASFGVLMSIQTHRRLLS